MELTIPQFDDPAMNMMVRQMKEIITSSLEENAQRIEIGLKAGTALLSVASITATGMEMAGDMYPATDNAYKCGTSLLRWSEGRFVNLYADSIDLNGNLDISSQATNFSLLDNNATALDIKEDINSYLKFVTLNGGEKIIVGKTIDINDGMNVDHIGELTTAHNVVFDNIINVDHINETTADHGVVVEGNLSKDSNLYVGNFTETDFPTSKLVVSEADTGLTYNSAYIGLMAEAVAVNADKSAYAIYGYAKTAGNKNALGGLFQATVTASADTGSAYGMQGLVNVTHAGGSNIATYGYAAGGATNYSFYGELGTLFNAGVIWNTSDCRLCSGSDVAGGTNVISMANCITAPTTTPSGGGVIYIENEALKYRGSGIYSVPSAGLYSFYGVSGILYNSGTGLIGSDANTTDFTHAKLIASAGNSTGTSTYNAGIVGEALADASYYGAGVVGIGTGSSAQEGVGVYAQGKVSASSNTTGGTGLWAESIDSHVGGGMGTNIGVYSNAQNGTLNYSFYGANGVLFNNGPFKFSSGEFMNYTLGTWSPVVARVDGGYTGTYTTQTGYYIKIGKLVHCYGLVKINAITGAGTGYNIISLPVTPGGERGGGPTLQDDALTTATKSLAPYTSSNTWALIYSTTGAYLNEAWVAGGTISFSCDYEAKDY